MAGKTPDGPSKEALAAARENRMRIHNMPAGTGPSEADNSTNSKWLDSITVEDARIIDRHMVSREAKLLRLKTFIEAGMNAPCKGCELWEGHSEQCILFKWD